VLNILWLNWEIEWASHQRQLFLLSIQRDFYSEFIQNIFDPLGILSPVTISVKLLMKELWEKNIDWDGPLEDSMKEK